MTPAPSLSVEPAAHNWRLRAFALAAGRTLAVLKERKRRETERGTLLRGAGTPPISESGLLRAATNLAENEPEQLLRPVNNNQ